eukprot:3832490-Pleurochrysis_carterae.AAC.1
MSLAPVMKLARCCASAAAFLRSSWELRHKLYCQTRSFFRFALLPCDAALSLRSPSVLVSCRLLKQLS